ncbi:MAG: hydroxymethylglutaryl-CoA reductase, degradative [Flavobacteriaceae bacterium]|nr:hydroxymethylglutaryl-CoA reductase, degradative [Flavobacteriaceae bacterium]|tara:strand:- start:35482 stop:37218 length:1737 start_codon:yes stop_codon:yes gene_type:complete
MSQLISGFSKFSKEQKIEWLTENHFQNPAEVTSIIKQYWNDNKDLQKLHDDFIENTITNYYLPFGIAPNFVINDENYVIPMVIEESSVVAAAALTAKFWSDKGGFKTEVISTKKVGHVHFISSLSFDALKKYFDANRTELRAATASISANMEKRGGGILDIQLKDCTEKLDNYYQIEVHFETKDSMGANFINSCLEAIAQKFKNDDIEIIMSILSNYVPECLVRAEVSCKIEDLGVENPHQFASKFYQAVRIAEVEPYRAVTHNKGIMNGIDAVILATGNDFRAVEAGVHAYASKDGHYSSLSHCSLDNDTFRFWIDVPMAVGTVGGLTALHPLAKLSLEILKKPNARELMQIIAAAGLAQNFAALRALTTKGIQHGHMKMHLMNILNQQNATEQEKKKVVRYFSSKTVSHSAVLNYLTTLRSSKPKHWVAFQKEDELRAVLSKLKVDTPPLFGRMNAQQMVEHLATVVKISNGNWKVNAFVEEEKAARRKPFLDTDGELQVGFKASFLSEGPVPVEFESLEKAIDELVDQVKAFDQAFQEDPEKIVIHPFFGPLDYQYWIKFHTKHFTHHCKQFGLL